MTEVESLQAMFADFARSNSNDSPLYGTLARRVAQRPDLAGMLLANPFPDRRLPVLLFAAVHDQVLLTPDCELGDWYPSVRRGDGASVRTDDASDAFAAMCAERRAAIESTIATRTVQTNETGRAAFLRFGIAAAVERCDANSVALVDVGSSAGLNLCLDRYRVDYQPGGSAGPHDSPVRIPCQTAAGFMVPMLPPIAVRVGIDQSPIDITDADGARWLLAGVWPDQIGRFERLQAAMALAATTEFTLVAGDAVADLGPLVDRVPDDQLPIVMVSWVLNYLSPSARADFVKALDRIGTQRPLAWIWAESPAGTAELPWPANLVAPDAPPLNSGATQLMLSTWRDGVRRDEHLAICHPHGRRLTPV